MTDSVRFKVSQPARWDGHATLSTATMLVWCPTSVIVRSILSEHSVAPTLLSPACPVASSASVTPRCVNSLICDRIIVSNMARSKPFDWHRPALQRQSDAPPPTQTRAQHITTHSDVSPNMNEEQQRAMALTRLSGNNLCRGQASTVHVALDVVERDGHTRLALDLPQPDDQLLVIQVPALIHIQRLPPLHR